MNSRIAETASSRDGLRWVDSPARLDFRFGEFVLGSASFQSRHIEAHFNELPERAEGPELPFDHFPPEVDFIKFESYPIAPESSIPRVTMFLRAIRYVPHRYRHFYVDLSVGFENYMRGFSTKTRHKLRQEVRRFRKFCGGEIHWCEHRAPDEAAAFYRLAREISKKTYQEKLLKRGLPDGDSFLGQLEMLAADNALRGYILFHRDAPVAYNYCRIHKNALISEYIGYDPAFREWSPGKILQYLILERQFAEGALGIFDFTQGEAPHKEFFANQSQFCADFLFFRRTGRNLAAVTLHSGLASTSAVISRLLARLGVKASLKKFVRRRTEE